MQDHQQLALPAPRPRRRRVRKNEEEPLAIEAKPVQYSDLLKDVHALEMDDSLEELRRMIQRTRGKMDSEMKVMDGFLADVSHIKGMQRNFDEPLAALPSSQSQPALKAPERVKALQTSSSAVALGDSRKLPKRSGPSLPALSHSQSAPTLGAATAMLALRAAEPIVLPKRRAPPQWHSSKVTASNRRGRL